MEWVIEQRRGSDHGGDCYLRKSKKSGQWMWDDIHLAEVFQYASKAQKALHKSGFEGQVQQLERTSPEDSFWLILRGDRSHNG